MSWIVRHRPSAAMVVACIALGVALGGTSYAAFKLPANSVGTKQLKKNAVTSIKVRNNSLTGADVRESTLRGVASLVDASTSENVGVSSQPTAGKLLPLSEDGRFPASVTPNVAARVYRSTDQTVPTQIAFAPVMRVSFDRVSFDTANFFDPAHPTQLKVPVTGIYVVIATVYWQVWGTEGNNRGISLFRNGDFIATDQRPPADETRQSVMALYHFDAGDTVEVGIGHDQWPSLAAVAKGDNAPSLAMALIASG